MKVEYENDARPGYGKFIFRDFIDAADGQWQLALYNSKLLFANDDVRMPLVKNKVFFPVSANKLAENTLEVRVGPAIVDNLDTYLNYRIALKNEAGKETKLIPVAIGEVIRSTDPELIKKDDFIPPSPPKPDPKPEVKTPSEPAKNAEVKQTPPSQPRVENITEAGQDAGETALLFPEPEKSSKKFIWLGIVCGAVIALGLLGWFFLAERSGEESAPPPQAKNASPAPAGIEEQVRQFMNGSAKNPGGAVSLADKLKPQTKTEEDAIYRLFYYAAAENNPTAQMKYGEILDPATPAWGTIEKDGYLAWLAFQKAKEANIAGAEKAQASLEQWLADEAAKGNRQAAAWLDKIKKGK